MPASEFEARSVMRVLPLGKGEHHEGRPGRKIRQDFYWSGKSSRPENLKAPFRVLFIFLGEGSQLLGFRRDLKGGALCEFLQSKRRTSRARPCSIFRQKNDGKANPVAPKI